MIKLPAKKARKCLAYSKTTQCFEYFIILVFVFVLTCAFIIGSQGIKHMDLNSNKSY